MKETTQSIGEWAFEVAGPPRTLKGARHVADRANKEMAELLFGFGIDSVEKTIEEAADVVIVLNHMAYAMGHDLFAAVDAKMAKNRARKWENDGHGAAQHIKEESK